MTENLFTVKVPCLTEPFGKDDSIDFEMDGADVRVWFPIGGGKTRTKVAAKDLLRCLLALFPEAVVSIKPKEASDGR